MLIYIVIFVALLIYAVFAKQRNLGAFGFTVFLLAFILGFRAEHVGADTSRYFSYYNYVANAGVAGHMELGWNAISMFAAKLHFSPNLFHFCVAIITIGLIGFVIVKESKRPFESLFYLVALGFYLLMFNGMRQFLAIAIVFFACYFMTINKRIVFCGITIASAVLFHYSCIFALPLFIADKIKVSAERLALLLIVSLFLGLMISQDSLVAIAGKYAHEITDSEFGFRESLFLFYIFQISQNILVFMLYKNIAIEDRNSFWIKMMVVSMIVSNLVARIVMGPRIVYLFSISWIIGVAFLPKKSLTSRVFLLFAFLNFARFMYAEYNLTEESLIPYELDFVLFS